MTKSTRSSSAATQQKSVRSHHERDSPATLFPPYHYSPLVSLFPPCHYSPRVIIPPVSLFPPCVIIPPLCHCERSEAIPLPRDPRLLRFARNDTTRVFCSAAHGQKRKHGLRTPKTVIRPFWGLSALLECWSHAPALYPQTRKPSGQCHTVPLSATSKHGGNVGNDPAKAHPTVPA